HEWQTLTGTVWVSAFWAVRSDAIAASRAPRAQIIEDFQHSRDAGLHHIDALADEWSSRIAVPRETIRTYLSENIWYLLDAPCLAGLDLFYRYGVECGAFPLAPRITFV
ncbi:MAG: MqnA/MqnD/SBP family protein, partial [Acidobacteriaceae bacterium]